MNAQRQMLTENNIIDKLSAYLEADGFRIEQRLTTHDKGIDIIAEKGRIKLYVEAKGETSSKSHTNRYGKPFTKNQVKSHISRAVFSSMKLLSMEPSSLDFVVAIALPETEIHRELVSQIFPSLKKLDIIIYWVGKTRIQKE